MYKNTREECNFVVLFSPLTICAPKLPDSRSSRKKCSSMIAAVFSLFSILSILRNWARKLTSSPCLPLAFTIATDVIGREIREQDKAWTRSSLLERPARTDRRGLRCSSASASTSTAASRRRVEGVAAGCEFYRIHTLTCKMPAIFD